MPHHRLTRAPRTQRRRRRRVVSVVAVSIMAGTAGLLAAPAAFAGGNSLYLANGSDHMSYGANGMVLIDGSITFDDTCGPGGVDDFVYPATDVYIVQAGSASAGAALTDAGGEGPNTIVGTGSGAFLGELIAVTTPSGALGDGQYDVVFDTCQDGVVGPGDAVFADAITVDVPDGQVPPVDASLRQLKDAAREEYAQWLKTHMALTALFKYDKAKSIASCILAPTSDCLSGILLKLYAPKSPLKAGTSWIQTSTLKLVANEAKHYGAIWHDPADPAFTTPTTLAPVERPEPPSTGGAVADALGETLAPMADETALSEALLHALERYQGAEAAGDAGWALVQARAVRDLSVELRDQLTSSPELQQLRDAMAATVDQVVANAQEAASFINRVRSTGFTAEERRTLANHGLSSADIAALEAGFVADGPQVAPTGDALLAQLDAQLAAQAGLADALGASATGWASLVTTLEQHTVAPAPTAVAGGPYLSTSGQLALDATGSVASAGSTLVSYAWDLNGDGAFDDGSGATPTVSLPAGPSRTIGVKVTDDHGSWSVDYAHVTVSATDRAPVVASGDPATAVSVVAGTGQTFTVQATDPDGDPLHYAWTLDGSPADGAGGASWTYQPTDSAVGEQVVSVTVTGAHRSAVHSWVVSVTRPDADGDGWTATPDCNDARADVHPGGWERLGNGIDDDCDPSTPDAPPGGLTGDVWSWGNAQGVGLPLSSTSVYSSPVPVPALTGVRQVDSTHAGGYAVLGDGTVRAWGQNYGGSLGDGTQTQSYVPVSVANVGGGGQLSGVTALQADFNHVVARRADGSVVAWGANENGQVGDGTTVATRPYPVQVLDGVGQPLTDVVAVSTGEQSSAAVTSDGTVWNWGVNACDGLGTLTKTSVATPNPLFAGGVVQLETGDSAFTLARKADGSVWACGGASYLLDRGSGSLTLDQVETPRPMQHLGPGSGVVDVSAASSVGVALREDGTVLLWGRNVDGELDALGVARGGYVYTPTAVPLPPGPPVVDVDADSAFGVTAVRADGTVVSWGANTYGAAGIGRTDASTNGVEPVSVGGRAVSVAESHWNGLALVRPADDPELQRPAFWVDASVADAAIGEGTGGTVRVSLSEPAPTDVTVGWALDGGASGTATVARGATSVDVPVSVADDAVDEPDETRAFTLTSVSGGVTVARGTAVVTVVDDDPAPTVSITSTSVEEGSTSLTDVPLEVTLSAPSGRDITVAYATADGTATAPSDYAAGSGTVLVPAGETHAVVHLAVRGDTVVEPHERFTVSLSDPVNATLGTATAAVDIRDDEPLLVTVTSPTVTEGDGGTTPAAFTVSVTPPPAGTSVSATWSVQAGTAEVPGDVQAADGTLTFTALSASASVTAEVVGDTVPETPASESFRLALTGLSASDGRPVLLADPTTATVLDNDQVSTPTWTFEGFDVPVDNPPVVNVVKAGSTVPLKFGLGGARGLDIFAPGYPASTAASCGNASTDALEETATPGSTTLTYDAATGRYHYNWQTDRSWGGSCRTLVLRFADGSERTALFRFR